VSWTRQLVAPDETRTSTTRSPQSPYDRANSGIVRQLHLDAEDPALAFLAPSLSGSGSLRNGTRSPVAHEQADQKKREENGRRSEKGIQDEIPSAHRNHTPPSSRITRIATAFIRTTPCEHHPRNRAVDARHPTPVTSTFAYDFAFLVPPFRARGPAVAPKPKPAGDGGTKRAMSLARQPVRYPAVGGSRWRSNGRGACSPSVRRHSVPSVKGASRAVQSLPTHVER
jgi:hypothetical protein